MSEILRWKWNLSIQKVKPETNGFIMHYNLNVNTKFL